MSAPLILFGLGAVICLSNVYTSFLRYPLLRLMGRPAETIQFVSGIPLFGSLFVALALLALWSELVWRWIGLALIILDTGGIHWFAATMLVMWLRDKRGSTRTCSSGETDRTDDAEQDDEAHQ
jgi:hypothetical protein